MARGKKGTGKAQINCLNCDKRFEARDADINRGHGKFCSRTCFHEYRAKNYSPPEPNVNCDWCGESFYINDTQKKASKSGLHFCSRKCKDRAQALDGIKELHLSHYGSGIACYRDIAFRVKDKKCERCGYDQNTAAIIVHHKDRNRNNNKIENLEVLCCNCHAIEHWSEHAA